MKQVEFFFDVGSPYSYLAYQQLPKMAKDHGASIVWRPILLGGLFQSTGNSSPATIPAKAMHAMKDLERWADHYGVAFKHNPYFPINTLPLMRGAIGMQMYHVDKFHAYLAAVFSAMFMCPRDLGSIDELAEVLKRAGISSDDFNALIKDDMVKEKLKQDTAAAVDRGVFGAPTFFVGREMYWGQDRLLFVEAKLRA
ncbi:MAG: 2-hydroxychromene-2-carboxylate isomerase [Pseudomonadales bacterium]|nr:2-hydroxychromene-2-carboxylate isomerase [Pseudomonadales bacterium]